MSNSITHQNQFENQELDAYGSSMRNNNNTFPLGTFHSSIQSIGGDRISRSTMDLVQAPTVLPEGSEISHTRHLMDLLGAANENNHHHQPQQGLSLSLGSHMLVPSSDEYRNRPLNLNPALMNPNYFMSEAREACNPPTVEHLTSDYFFGTFASSSNSLNNRSPSTSSYGVSAESFAAVIGNSRYLKPVQSLLEDLVDVGGNVIDRINEKYAEKLFHGSRTGARTLSSELKAELRNSGHLLADKHERQMKIAKLIALLEEVGLLSSPWLFFFFSLI